MRSRTRRDATRPALASLAALAALTLGACFSPDYGDGDALGALCSDTPRDCPGGYVCVPRTAEENRCIRAALAPPPTIKLHLDRDAVQFKAVPPLDVLTVSVDLGNFAIDKDAISPTATPEARFGHYHIYLDDLSNFSPGAANYVSGKETVVPVAVDLTKPPFKQAKAGPHTLFVSLANHNHTELNPPVRALAKFTVIP